MKGNSIKRRLNQVNKIEQLTAKLIKFLGTKRGNQFVNMLHKDRLDVLCNNMNVSWILYTKNHSKVYTWIEATLKKEKIKINKPNPMPTKEWKKIKHPQPKIYSPTKKQNEKNTIHNLTRTQLMHGYEMHLIQKWESKNPKPVLNEKEPDMFYSQHLEDWTNAHEQIIERIRDSVVSRYDKLHLYAKYEKSKDYDVPIATIKDVDGTGHTINEVDISESKVLKEAQKITNKQKDKRPDLIATHIMDHKRQKGRLIIPKAA